MPIYYDSLIKKPGPNDYTPEMVSEIFKCYHNVVYFAEKYCCENLESYQKDILECFADKKFNIVKKSSSSDVDKCLCIFTMWICLFKQNTSIAVVDLNRETAKLLANNFKSIYENLPLWLKCGVTEYNIHSIEFENRSKIFFRETSDVWFCGEMIDLLICNNFAFIDTNVADNFWKSTFPTIHFHGSVIIVSELNGINNKFYELLKDAEEGKSSFVSINLDFQKKEEGIESEDK